VIVVEAQEIRERQDHQDDPERDGGQEVKQATFDDVRLHADGNLGVVRVQAGAVPPPVDPPE
jgi:hypothetical protein